MYRDAMSGGRFGAVSIRATGTTLTCAMAGARPARKRPDQAPAATPEFAAAWARPAQVSRSCAGTARVHILGPVEPGYQLVVFSREEIRAVTLPPAGEVTIGRDEASTIHIVDPAVSHHHAVL